MDTGHWPHRAVQLASTGGHWVLARLLGQPEAGLGQEGGQGVFMSHMTQAVEAGPADYRPLVQAGSQAVHQSTANTTLDPCRSSPLDVLYWQHNTYTQLLST